MDLDKFIEESAESFLYNYEYSDGLLSLYVETEQVEKFSLDINTSLISFNVPKENSRAQRTFYIELIDLSEVLPSNNGVYIPSFDFPKLMAEKRQNLNLAYGLRFKEFKYLISLKGSSVLCSAILKVKSDVVIRVLE
jgi:hypothetical protein